MCGLSTEPVNGNLNLLTRYVQIVARDPEMEERLERATQRPHVVMARNEPLHTWPVGLRPRTGAAPLSPRR